VAPNDSGGWRISDADRDQISAVLDQHAAEGRLEMDELEQRVGVLLAAQTRAQAAAVVGDLPPLEKGPEGAPPELPDWFTADWRDELAPAAVAPLSRSQERDATRKREQHHHDENAIGHTFQAAHRSIDAQLQRATAAGDSGEADRLRQQLHEAERIEACARQALGVGDRAQLQQHLAQLRTLA
jgi:Domain of unknown function (DUF1707)